MMRRLWNVLWTIAAVWSLCGAAIPLEAKAVQPPPVRVELQQLSPVEHSPSEIQVALDLAIEPGWHTGTLPGMAPAEDLLGEANALQIHWELPPGVELVKISGPDPESFEMAGLSTQGYADQVRLIAELRLPPQGVSSAPLLAATVDWVACSTRCVPGSSTASLQIDPGVMQEAPVPAQGAEARSLVMWLLFAALGGLCLNFMPCVLPVLGLKIMQLVEQSRAAKQHIVFHMLAYVGGVLVCFLLLGGVMIALKGAGLALGWGFQLQSPLFVALMALLLGAMGLSQLGLFELGGRLARIGDGQGGSLWHSLLAGALTTLVATPCTGPFLGSAMAFSMTLSSLGQLAMMGVMGLGMAAPFVLILCFPGLLRWLPKPGRWMLWFKRAMGLVLLLSSAWLAWVFQALVPGGLLSLAAAGGLVLLAATLYGQGQRRCERGQRALPMQVLSSSTLVLASLLLWFGFGGGEGLHTPQLAPYHYSAERVEALLDAGQPVFVNFTARWCLLCQVNHPFLHSDEVQGMLREKGVTFLEADLTQRQPELMAELSHLGRESLPAYVLLQPGHAPEFLPELLRMDHLVEALNRLPSTT